MNPLPKSLTLPLVFALFLCLTVTALAKDEPRSTETARVISNIDRKNSTFSLKCPPDIWASRLVKGVIPAGLKDGDKCTCTYDGEHDGKGKDKVWHATSIKKVD